MRRINVLPVFRAATPLARAESAKGLQCTLIDWARAHPGIEKFELQVRSSNARAIKLYEGLGFVEEGRKTRRLKYGPNDYQDDVYMALWVRTINSMASRGRTFTRPPLPDEARFLTITAAR